MNTNRANQDIIYWFTLRINASIIQVRTNTINYWQIDRLALTTPNFYASRPSGSQGRYLDWFSFDPVLIILRMETVSELTEKKERIEWLGVIAFGMRDVAVKTSKNDTSLKNKEISRVFYRADISYVRKKKKKIRTSVES